MTGNQAGKPGWPLRIVCIVLIALAAGYYIWEIRQGRQAQAPAQSLVEPTPAPSPTPHTQP